VTLLERLNERWERMDGAAATKIDRILKDRREAAAEIEHLRSALKLAAAYWSDYHVPCVYEEWDKDCDLCPVIGAVRAALGDDT
jgi:hypothetical protein